MCCMTCSEPRLSLPKGWERFGEPLWQVVCGLHSAPAISSEPSLLFPVFHPVLQVVKEVCGGRGNKVIRSVTVKKLECLKQACLAFE